MKINTKGCGHGNFTSASGNHFWEYSDENDLKILNAALFILKNNIRGMKPCNERFKKLPGGRSFDDVLNDDNVWVNYEERSDRGFYGVTSGQRPNEISIAKNAFKKGRWWVAGTLVHEMAHVNGAPSTTGDADDTLLYCGVKNAYEGVIGMNDAGIDTEYA